MAHTAESGRPNKLKPDGRTEWPNLTTLPHILCRNYTLIYCAGIILLQYSAVRLNSAAQFSIYSSIWLNFRPFGFQFIRPYGQVRSRQTSATLGFNKLNQTLGWGCAVLRWDGDVHYFPVAEQDLFFFFILFYIHIGYSFNSIFIFVCLRH